MIKSSKEIQITIRKGEFDFTILPLDNWKPYIRRIHQYSSQKASTEPRTPNFAITDEKRALALLSHRDFANIPSNVVNAHHSRRKIISRSLVSRRHSRGERKERERGKKYTRNSMREKTRSPARARDLFSFSLPPPARAILYAFTSVRSSPYYTVPSFFYAALHFAPFAGRVAAEIISGVYHLQDVFLRRPHLPRTRIYLCTKSFLRAGERK